MHTQREREGHTRSHSFVREGNQVTHTHTNDDDTKQKTEYTRSPLERALPFFKLDTQNKTKNSTKDKTRKTKKRLQKSGVGGGAG